MGTVAAYRLVKTYGYCAMSVQDYSSASEAGDLVTSALRRVAPGYAGRLTLQLTPLVLIILPEGLGCRPAFAIKISLLPSKAFANQAVIVTHCQEAASAVRKILV